MEEKLLANASFSEVYDFLKGRQDSEMFQCFKSLFGISLLFLPGLVCRDTAPLINPEILADLAAGAGLAGSGVCALVGDAVKSVFNLLKKKNYKDYTTRYEQMQIAQVMLVYAAYFDAVSRYLPDENNEIALSEKVRKRISKKGLQTYKAELEENVENGRLSKKLSEKMALPDPTWEFSHYKKQLKYFYTELNTEFIRFFRHTQFFEDLEKGDDEAERALNREQKEYFLQILNGLPENAVKIYEQQYFQLQEAFPDFAVWAEHNEHSRMEAGIDVGFKAVSRELKRLASMLSYPEDKAAEVLSRYQTKYTEYIKGPVIEYNVSEPVQDIVFPEKGNIFIPQAFQSVSFHQGMRVESEEAWEDAYAGEDIGGYISSILRHPRCGALPLLILGLPGAGKTLLCHMLAARIFLEEYYVIIIRLRDIAAEDTIMKQVDTQIERDLGERIGWNDLRRASLDKPFLLIFDGYDELLQASGKTYSDYLNRIAEFQASQRTLYGKFVRCIVTSRTTLIDKASIPAGSQILRLCDFDDLRIQTWADIWNQANEAYFSAQGLEKLEIAADSRVRELARQPLLLLMLALYEVNGGRLKEQEDISRSELYYKLIRDFIAREEQKDPKFRQRPEDRQEKAIRREMRCLGTAALGMYNRRKLFISTEELNRDLLFLMPDERPADPQDEYALEYGEKLAGRFFFIHSSESSVSVRDKTAKAAAYEFLHNTFGEFLTAYYIADAAFRLVKRERLDAEAEERFAWPSGLKKDWHVSLAYAPLFTRPVILNMIHELSDIFAAEYGLEASAIQESLDNVFREEVRRIRTGEMFALLNETLGMQENPYSHPELMLHVAAYSVNLILLRAVIGTESYDFAGTLGDAEDWKKLTHIWRYAFSEEDLVNLSYLLYLKHTDTSYRITYNYARETKKQTGELSKLARLGRISSVLGDDAAFAVISAFHSGIDPQIQSVLEKERLALKTKFALNEVLLYLTRTKQYRHEHLRNCMGHLLECSEQEKDILGLYVYYSLLCVLMENGMLDQVEILRLFGRDAFQKMDRILEDDLNSGVWILSNVISQEILKGSVYLPDDRRLKLLDDFSQYFMHRNFFFMQQFGRGGCFTVNILEIFCRILEDTVGKGRRKIPANIIELLAIIPQDNYKFYDLGRLLGSVFRVCRAFGRRGRMSECHRILHVCFIKMGRSNHKNGIIKEMGVDTDTLKAAVECCYYEAFEQSTGKTGIWKDFFWQLLCGTKVIEQLALSSEESFYHLLCLLCSGEVVSFMAAEDSRNRLLKLVSWNGRCLSLRVLKKIQEYGEQCEDEKLAESVEKILGK